MKADTTPPAERSRRCALFAELVDELDLDDDELENLFGVNVRTLRRWRNGHITVPPQVLTLLAVLAEHDISPEQARGYAGLIKSA